MIEDGIKQPLRFYDTRDKQNFRRTWARKSGLEKQQVVICPENSIIPFQIRRKRSLNPPVVFDLYTYPTLDPDDMYLELDLMTIIPAPTTNHLRVFQVREVDNIIWNPQLSFTSNIPCGLHDVVISDGVHSWYSEVFRTVDFDDTAQRNISVSTNAMGIPDDDFIGWSLGGIDYQLVISNKPF